MANGFAGAHLPFKRTGYSTDYVGKGGAVGDTFFDHVGRKFRVWALDTALINDEMRDGEVMVFKDATTVTNDVSAGLLGATFPKAAGVAFLGDADAVPESASTAEGSLKYVALLVNGIHDELVTDGGDDIVAGDSLIPATAADGACDRLAATTQVAADYEDANAATDDGTEIAASVTAALTESIKRAMTVFATALANDVDAGNTVKALIHCG